MPAPLRSGKRSDGARRAWRRVVDVLEWVLLTCAIGGAAGGIAWLVRHYW